MAAFVEISSRQVGSFTRSKFTYVHNIAIKQVDQKREEINIFVVISLIGSHFETVGIPLPI